MVRFMQPIQGHNPLPPVGGQPPQKSPSRIVAFFKKVLNFLSHIFTKSADPSTLATRITPTPISQVAETSQVTQKETIQSAIKTISTTVDKSNREGHINVYLYTRTEARHLYTIDRRSGSAAGGQKGRIRLEKGCAIEVRYTDPAKQNYHQKNKTLKAFIIENPEKIKQIDIHVAKNDTVTVTGLEPTKTDGP